MRNIFLIIFFFIGKLSFAQDGSDIFYVDIKDLDSKYIGKYLQIDFYNNSLWGFTIDTISLEISGHRNFKEVRNDDGFNNWFCQQYMESVGNDSTKFRVQKFKLLSVYNDSLTVKSFGHYFVGDSEIFSKFIVDTLTISRAIINQILFDANPPIDKGLSVYRVYDYAPGFTQKENPDCHYCLDETDENLFNSPLLSDWEIKKFDYENQTIELTESGKREIEKLQIPLQGMPVALTLNGEIIYVFWFWNLFSSFGCDRVFTYPQLNFSIEFGLPNDFKYGTDPRFDKRLEEYCKKYK